MPIDVQSEKVLSLKEAAKTLPSIDGKKPHLSTVWRWCRVGLHGVNLEYARFGNRIVTSTEALNRFANALAASDGQPGRSSLSIANKTVRTEKARAESVQRAHQNLARRAGL